MKSIGCTMEGTLRNFAFDADQNRIDAVGFKHSERGMV
jgi:hypothetical protein